MRRVCMLMTRRRGFGHKSRWVCQRLGRLKSGAVKRGLIEVDRWPYLRGY